MSSRRRNLSLAFIGLFLAAGIFGTTSAIANTPGFKSVLRPYLEHSTIVAGRKDSKKTSNAYLHLNKGSYNGWFWVDQIGNGQVSDKKFVRGGHEMTLPYTNGSGWTGKTRLRGHQEFWGFGEDPISGWINFG